MTASREPSTPAQPDSSSPLDAPDAFQRLVEGDDREYYARDRMVSHLDSLALQTVERLIGELLVEESPVILDLMAAWDSHIPADVRPARVVGLGLNLSELEANPCLDAAVIHDLNRNPRLPFEDDTFDIVLNTASVDYMTRPLDVFQEVARVLKPGGLFLVIFSNRMFPEKAVRIWREAGEEERMILVEEFFARAGGFEKPRTFISKGRPRPQDDKYSRLLSVSDPIYAVYADKAGGRSDCRPRPLPRIGFAAALSPAEVERNKTQIKSTLRCPHCGSPLKKWAVPENAFGQTWDNDYMYICFNDCCPYYVRGWQHLSQGGSRGVSYRLMYHPEKDRCFPIPVPSPRALREGILENPPATRMSL